MEVFKAFRGREPSVDALLRHTGLEAAAAEAEAAAAAQ
jgi:oligopeptidase A